MNELNDGSHLVAPAGGIVTSESEEPPGAGHETGGRRHPRWHDVPDHLWQDWRWQRQHAIRTTAELVELLPMSAEHVAALECSWKPNIGWRFRRIISR